MKGISAGRETLLVGASGSAKTTFAIQAAYNIVKDFENGLVIHEDFEHATDPDRVMSLTGMDEEEMQEKYILQNEGISLESFFSYVNEIANLKLDNEKELAVDTGLKDSDGKPIKKLPPTVFIVDSLITMQSKKIIDDDEMDGGGMKAAKSAKDNNQVIKRLVGSSLISSANIILMVINHITTKISTGYIAKPKELNWLGDDETLPGGTSFLYLADTVIRFTPGAKLEPDKDFYIKGFYDHVQILKSRSNASGVKFSVIYDQNRGFDNILTNFKLLLDLKYLKGTGVSGYYFPELPDVKVKRKDVHEAYETNSEWRELFNKYVDGTLIQLVPGGKLDEEFSKGNMDSETSDDE